jgi:hypothetical protein
MGGGPLVIEVMGFVAGAIAVVVAAGITLAMFIPLPRTEGRSGGLAWVGGQFVRPLKG